MRSRWTLRVEGLGKLGRAEVRLSPLLLLAGENNSGKSYLATLLWGLLSPQETHLFDKAAPSPAYQECAAWLREQWSYRQEHPEVTLQTEDLARFVRWFNDLLAAHKTEFVQRIFNSRSLDVRHIEIRDFSCAEPITLRWRSAAPEFITETADSLQIGAMDRADLSPEEVHAALIAITSKVLLCDACGATSRWPIAAFLPASRTGFMLLSGSIARSLLRTMDRFEPARSPIELPLPSLRFLEGLAAEMKGDGAPYAAEAAFLEAALHGRIERRDGPGMNEFLYQEGERLLPMGLSSSLVTEVAPIVLTLRHVADLGAMILEEPEAHLHPKMQRALARVVVRLVRKGLFVWLTTHSENFCQQINNFIKLGSLPPLERQIQQRALGYDEQDFLTLDDVGGYQIAQGESGSTVTPLEMTREGLIMPTFNEELISLSKETLGLQRHLKGAA